jgi:transmembrane sensor
MDQETWKLVLDYLSAKEQGKVRELADLEERLQDWLRKDPQHQQDLDQAVRLWEHTAVLPESEDWKASFDQIQISLQTEKSKPNKIFIFWSAAAAVVAVMTMFIVLNKSRQAALSVDQITWVTKTSNPGKITNILLPDSTEIWLNAGSSISFPDNIRRASFRTVKLNGEAFFKVKRDPKHPFIVRSLNIQTRVLGTSFNIRAWKNSSPEVTVLTGKVAVSRDSAGVQSKAIHLVPNQKGVCDLGSGLLHLENIDDAQVAIGWRQGKMAFDQAPIETVFEAIERRYGVQIIADRAFKACKLTARFDNVSINEVLKTIQMTLDIRYTINKQTIYIKGGKCN